MIIRDIKIRLSEAGDVNRFVKLVTNCQIEADVRTVNNGRHIVPADSIMGMYSLDLRENLLVSIVNGEEESIDRFVMGCSSNDWVI